jgi:hypothetical protein
MKLRGQRERQHSSHGLRGDHAGEPRAEGERGESER